MSKRFLGRPTRAWPYICLLSCCASSLAFYLVCAWRGAGGQLCAVMGVMENGFSGSHRSAASFQVSWLVRLSVERDDYLKEVTTVTGFLTPEGAMGDSYFMKCSKHL